MFFIKQLEDYIRIQKATELTISLNPETEDFDYIADESKTTELSSYSPSISGLPLTMYEGEPDFDMIWEYFYNLKTGSDAVTEGMIVYPKKVGDGYMAWQFSLLIVCNEMNLVDKTISFDSNIRGTVKKGVAKIDTTTGKVTFTENAQGA
ncbi:hypothetical protein ACWG0P_07095 [Amedibacillus sp. YH-ame6]